MQQEPATPAIRLHSYWRSSAAYRVRIALALKGLEFDLSTWKMVDGEHRSEAYRALAPFGLVPMLEIDGLRLQQSMAIIDYLEERFPARQRLLPEALPEKARARAVAQLIACEVHPLNNLRVLHELRSRFGADDAQVRGWYRHWCEEGLGAAEAALAQGPGQAAQAFAFGGRPGLVECFLIPQLYNARRFGVDTAAYPRLSALDAACEALPAFVAARPESQPDAPA